jgi:MFS family permease
VLCLGFFVILLNTTIVKVAIPTMLDSLGASLDQILWVVNAYLLTLAVLLITASRPGDIFGPRALFALGLGDCRPSRGNHHRLRRHHRRADTSSPTC